MQEAVETFLQERTPGARIPFATSHLLPKVLEGFQYLLELSEAERKKWAITAPGDEEPDDGLVVKEGGTSDYKAFFHFRPRLYKLLRRDGVRITHHQLNWLGECRNLHTACVARGIEIAGWLDAHFASLDTKVYLHLQREVRAMIQHPLRLLSYDLRPGTIAQPHVDQSLLTMHLWDNYPGLRLWGTPITPVPDECIVFPGAKMELATRDLPPPAPRVMAATHDVFQDKSQRDRRMAAVFFLHTPMELPPGYVTKRPPA